MIFAISLGLFTGSVVAIALMMIRKRPALQSLLLKEEIQRTIEGSNLIEGGVFSLLRDRMGLSTFWHSGVVVAVEKSLRRSRLWILRVEARMSVWIEGLRVRKANGLAEINREDVIGEEEESSYLSSDLHRREHELIKRIAENPKAVTNYKELGFLYLNNDLEGYARETFEMAMRLGSKDKQIQKALKRLDYSRED